VIHNVYRSTTSPVPIDAGHLVTSGITETEYTDCGNVTNRVWFDCVKPPSRDGGERRRGE